MKAVLSSLIVGGLLILAVANPVEASCKYKNSNFIPVITQSVEDPIHMQNPVYFVPEQGYPNYSDFIDNENLWIRV